MNPTSMIDRSEFILGGQKSGKSRRAEEAARRWLEADDHHHAVLIATAEPWDAEMARRIARHQHDRALRVPGLATLEEPRALAEAIREHSRPGTLVVVDCLTLWLTNLMMPSDKAREPVLEKNSGTDWLQSYVQQSHVALLCEAVRDAAGPLVLVGNEIGLGVIPMGREVREFVDTLGQLNQAVARACERVTLMAAGLPLTLKPAATDAR